MLVDNVDVEIKLRILVINMILDIFASLIYAEDLLCIFDDHVLIYFNNYFFIIVY